MGAVPATAGAGVAAMAEAAGRPMRVDTTAIMSAIPARFLGLGDAGVDIGSHRRMGCPLCRSEWERREVWPLNSHRHANAVGPWLPGMVSADPKGLPRQQSRGSREGSQGRQATHGGPGSRGSRATRRQQSEASPAGTWGRRWRRSATARRGSCLGKITMQGTRPLGTHQGHRSTRSTRRPYVGPRYRVSPMRKVRWRPPSTTGRPWSGHGQLPSGSYRATEQRLVPSGRVGRVPL